MLQSKICSSSELFDLTVACICSVQCLQYKICTSSRSITCTHSTWKVSYETSANCYHAFEKFFTAPLTVSCCQCKYFDYCDLDWMSIHSGLIYITFLSELMENVHSTVALEAGIVSKS